MPLYFNMKIGILIPTRGDRPKFLKHALYLVGRQTMKPDFIEVINDKPITKDKDITWRYRLGCERLFEKGSDVIIFWEDDDYYSSTYIQSMIYEYIKVGKPDIFGVDTTIYYHLKQKKYAIIPTPGRSSAMSTMVTKAIMDIKWPAPNHVWFDLYIWERMQGKTHHFNKPIAIGIKHGIGMCGGSGHFSLNYKTSDPGSQFLKSIVSDYSLSFYENIINPPV